MAHTRAHEALSIVLYHHAGALQSFHHDERKRIQRAYDIIEAMEYTLEPHYDTLWHATSGEPTPADFARCAQATLPHLQATLARLLRLVPTYIALPLRTIPNNSWSAAETLDVFRDAVDFRMAERGMAIVFCRQI